MNGSTLLALACCTALAPSLLAQVQNPQTQGASQNAMPANARQFNRMRVPGDEVEKNVNRLLEDVHFYKSLKSALGAGRSQGKPVLWIHALGEVDGFL